MSGRGRERPPSGRVNSTPASGRPLSSRPSTTGSGNRLPVGYNSLPSNNGSYSDRSSPRYLPPSYPTSNNQRSGRSSDRSDGSYGSVRSDRIERQREHPNVVNGSSGVADSGVAATLISGRSDTSELSTNEVLRRLREANDISKNRQAEAEIQALGDYNYYSRPRSSTDLPLRTVLLDPAVNNFPRSRTRTELMRRIKLSAEPHPSYDLDNDGYVSQEDYRLAKRFDFDGNGVLDPSERKVGKRVLAEEFFKRHSHQLSIFGPNIANTSHKKNVENLVNSYCFERAYDKLLQLERTVAGEGSKRVLNCMRNSYAEELLKHNYYTNKFDATAWNDLDAIPRSVSKLGTTTDHEGSRKRLLFSRREALRSELQDRMQATTFKNSNAGGNTTSAPNFRRMNLITNVAIENS